MCKHLRNRLIIPTFAGLILNRMKLLLTIGVTAAAMLLLCIRLLLQKNGHFSSEHISENKKMKENGIRCATAQDKETRQKNNHKINIKNL